MSATVTRIKRINTMMYERQRIVDAGEMRSWVLVIPPPSSQDPMEGVMASNVGQAAVEPHFCDIVAARWQLSIAIAMGRLMSSFHAR